MEGTDKTVCAPKLRSEAETPQESEPKPPASAGGSPVEADPQGLPTGTGAQQQQARKVPLGVSPLGGHH